MSVKEDVKKYVRQQCAGHTEYGECLYYPDGEDSCRYFREGFIGHVRCMWFERCVLPGSPELQEKYWRELTGSSQEAKNMSICTCGTKFIKRSNRHKRCDHCASIRKRDTARELMRKKRS